jgi:pyridoxine 4-dehydrogenase
MCIQSSMATKEVHASASGTFTLGGDIHINRLGFGAMRITGEGIWGEPKNAEQAKKVLPSSSESTSLIPPMPTARR